MSTTQGQVRSAHTVGALLGGFLGGLIFQRNLGDFFDIWTWVLAIGGSIIVMLIHGLIVNRKKA